LHAIPCSKAVSFIKNDFLLKVIFFKSAAFFTSVIKKTQSIV
jgi:hypothetical protein